MKNDIFRILIEIPKKIPKLKSSYVVNIGCGDGKTNDPLFPFFEAGAEGLAIDLEYNLDLYKNIPNPKVIKLMGIPFTPNNSQNILSAVSCPKEFDVLKIDIDSYDGDVLRSILLLGYKPKIIQVEVNPDIPPPISFSVLYDTNYKCLGDDGKIGGFYGMSLSYAVNTCSIFDYKLLELDFSNISHDAIFIHKDFLNNYIEIPNISTRELWLNTNPGYPHFQEDDIDSLLWRQISDINHLGEFVKSSIIKSMLKKHKGKINYYFNY